MGPEFHDRDSFKAWLDALPAEVGEVRARQIAIWLAHRSAMRVLPLAWEWFASEDAAKRGLSAMPVLRRNLISGVAAETPTPEIKNAVAHATGYTRAEAADAADADDATEASDQAAYTAFSANFATSASCAAEYSADSAEVAFSNDHSDTMAAKVWKALVQDTAVAQFHSIAIAVSLWHEDNGPFNGIWTTLRDRLRQTEGWAFWIAWYEDALAGRAPNWDMLQEIALIDPEIWDRGPGKVNPAIADIVAKYALRDEVAALRAERTRHVTQTASVAQRSHNQPPDLVDAPVEVARQVTIIWAGLDEAAKELEAQQPDKALLARIGEQIWAAAKALGAYCLAVGNTVVMSGAKAAGPVLVADYLSDGKVVSFARHLLDYAMNGLP